MKTLYSLLFYLCLPAVIARVFWRARKEPRYKEDLQQRLGYVTGEADAIWVHCVSAGETIAAGNLIKRLVQRGYRVVLSNMTPAGRERAEALFADQSMVQIVYAPYDLPHGVKRFLSALKPRALLIIDTELWPNMIAETRTQGVPVYLVNGRLSEKSARGYARVSWLSRPMFAQLTGVFAQSEAQAERFRNLGSAHVTTAGSIKFDASLPADFAVATERLARQFQGRKVLLAASTHEGEEALMLNAYQQFVDDEHILVIALRHIHRLDSVISQVSSRGFNYQQHSYGAALDPATDVYLVDTMGELMFFYGICESAFVGGSLVDKGGHNPMEPGSLGKPMMMGPYRRNIADIAELFAQQGALQLVRNEAEILDFWRKTSDPEQNAIMGEAAISVVNANRGTLDKVLDVVLHDLESSKVE